MGDKKDKKDKSEKKNYKKLDNYIKYIREENEKLEELFVMQKADELFGGVPKDVQKHIAKKLDISKERVRGIMKYNCINEDSRGKYHISVCMGTTCIGKGAKEIMEAFEDELKIKKGEITKDEMFSLDRTGCIKYCVMAPIVSINGKLFNQVNVEDVGDIINCYKN